MSIATPSSLDTILSKGVSLKICGLTNRSEISELLELGVQVIGINFWKRSKRYVSKEVAPELLKPYAGKLLRVGVFVNDAPSEIIQLLKNDVIDVAQLHGDESPSDCLEIKAQGYHVIKAFGVDETLNSKLINSYESGVDAILLDAHAPNSYGGTGETFDWQIAKVLAEENPSLSFILAGGITADNIEEAINQTQASMIDVASGAEISPGVKDMEKISLLLNVIHQHH